MHLKCPYESKSARVLNWERKMDGGEGEGGAWQGTGWRGSAVCVAMCAVLEEGERCWIMSRAHTARLSA